MRKQAGDANVVSAMICNIIGILVFYLLITVMVDHSHILELKNNIFTICDSYLEGMMSDGYLTEENRRSLERILEEMGADDVSLLGSTVEEANYGERVALSISFDLPVKVHKVTEWFSSQVELNTVAFHYRREATSFH